MYSVYSDIIVVGFCFSLNGDVSWLLRRCGLSASTINVLWKFSKASLSDLTDDCETHIKIVINCN